MQRNIKFGNTHAQFVAEMKGYASLVVETPDIPVTLCDAIGETENVAVESVEALYPGCHYLEINYSVTKNELLETVCEAISRVYDSETSVSFVTP